MPAAGGSAALAAGVLKTKNHELKKNIKEQRMGKEYWKIALFISLLFFAIEIFLIKLIKL